MSTMCGLSSSGYIRWGRDPHKVESPSVTEEDTEQAVLMPLRRILSKLTSQKLLKLSNQVIEVRIDTEEKLNGAVALIFERAISEPHFSATYADVCHCLMELNVPATDNTGLVSFRKQLISNCKKAFDKIQAVDETQEKMKKELQASTNAEERERLKMEINEAKNKARRRALGSIKFIGEIFKLQMLKESIIHGCVGKLLKKREDGVSLECLCQLLSAVGKELDLKAKSQMDQYFYQMHDIIKERKISPRIRFMLQDVLDLMKRNWVTHPQVDGQRGAPLEYRPINNTSFSRITKPGVLDSDPRAPAGDKPGPVFSSQDYRKGVPRLLCGSVPPSADSDHIVPCRSNFSQQHGGDRGTSDHQKSCDHRINGNQIPERRCSREAQEHDKRVEDGRASAVPVLHVTSTADDKDRGSLDSSPSEALTDNPETAPTSPPPPEPALTDQQAENKTNAIFEEYRHSTDLREVDFTIEKEVKSAEVVQKKVLSEEELRNKLFGLLQDGVRNQCVIDWVEDNLDEEQMASNQFIRALMTSVCQSAIICDNTYRLHLKQMWKRTSLLRKYISDEEKELQALYALQAMMVHMEHPNYLLQMFFHVLCEEDIIEERTFYLWKSSTDPAEQTGKEEALRSVSAFFAWLHKTAVWPK